MGSHSFNLKLIVFAFAVDVTLAQVAPLESFRVCIVDQGLPPDLIVHHSSTANSTLYTQLDHRWNTRPEHVHPLAYFVPRDTSDVQVCVRCARANNIPVIPKSGGHSAELLSYGNANTIVISFQNMKKIQVNASDETAIIESGALLGEISQTLLNEGGFGLASGHCDYVGIGGITLGGGDGPVAAIHNLTIDNTLEMKMVDANGDVHLVDANVNPDLFWALRGIGSGYIGIVTEFKFKLFNATDLRITRIIFYYELEDVMFVYLAFQDFLVWTNEEGLNVQTIFNVYGTRQPLVNVQLFEEISKGQPSKVDLFTSKVNEIFSLPAGRTVTLDHPSYTEARRDGDSMEFISISADPGTYVKKKSFFVSRTYSAEELENIVQALIRGKNIPFQFLTWGYTGAVTKINATDMSYVHRGHFYSFGLRIVEEASFGGEAAERAMNYLNELETAFKIIDNGESYQNYVDLDLDDFMKRYYGINGQRLIEIKTKWDPDNYFRNEQSIPIANMASKSLVLLPTFLLCLCLLMFQCIKIVPIQVFVV